MEILTIAGGKEVLECGSVDVETSHSVTFAVEILERAYSAHIQLTDTVIADVDVRQSLEYVEVDSLVSGQHQSVHSQVELLHMPHLGQRVRV